MIKIYERHETIGYEEDCQERTFEYSSFAAYVNMIKNTPDFTASEYIDGLSSRGHTLCKADKFIKLEKDEENEYVFIKFNSVMQKNLRVILKIADQL